MDLKIVFDTVAFLCSGTQVTGKKSIAVSTCIRNCPTLKGSSWNLRKRTGAAEAVRHLLTLCPVRYEGTKQL